MAPRPGVSTDAPVSPRWWELLGDPQLNALVARADASNQSLAAALGAVRAAYAGVGVSESKLWPDIGAGAEYARTQTNVARLASSGVKTEPYDLYAYGVGMSAWEIDLWGSVRRQCEAAKADAEKQVELLRDALVSVRAQVGANYVQLRTLQAQREVLGRNIATATASRDAVKARFDAGVTTALDLARADAQRADVDAGKGPAGALASDERAELASRSREQAAPDGAQDFKEGRRGAPKFFERGSPIRS